MEEKEINPEESLTIIHSMIRTAKNKLAHDGFLFIFWGWLTLSAALIHYYCLMLRVHKSYLIWPLITPVGIIVSIIYGIGHKRRVNLSTYIDKYLGYTWTAFMLAVSIVLSFLPLHGMKASYFFVMLLYGISTFITGGLLNFRPMIVGSLFSFTFAGISVLFGKDEQLLLLSGCMLCSYIIPGHLLRLNYHS